MPARSTTTRSPKVDRTIHSAAESVRKFGRFRQALRAGNYHALVGPGYQRVLRAAAADTGLETEAAVLRLVLLRLLNEEPDPHRAAAAVARLTGVAAQIARLRGGDDPLAEVRMALAKELDEYEAELAAEQAVEHAASGDSAGDPVAANPDPFSTTPAPFPL